MVDRATYIVLGCGCADWQNGVTGAVITGVSGEHVGRDSVFDAVRAVDVSAPGGIGMTAVAGGDVAALEVVSNASFLGTEVSDGRVYGQREADKSREQNGLESLHDDWVF